MCFLFSLNFFLIFSHNRNLTPEKLNNFVKLQFMKNKICNYTKKPFVNLKKQCFGHFYHSRIEVQQNCSALFMLVPLLRENLRKLRGNKKQIIRTLVNKTFWMFLRSVSKTGILEYPCSLISAIVSKLNVVVQGSMYTSSSFVMTSLT